MSANTTVPLAAGTITCGLDGSLTLSPALPNANSVDGAVKNTHVKIQAKMSNCGGAVTGGKAPITGGTLLITGFLEPGASCADLSDGMPPDFTFDPNKMIVKWGGTTSTGKHITVGKSHTDIFGTGDFLFGGWEYASGPFGDTDSFAGESATIDLMLDKASLVSNCALGKIDPATGKPATLSSVTFSSANGSTLSVAP